MASCVFCAVIAGNEPAHVVLDDDIALAFLDRRPVFKGHILLVPKQHVVTLADLPGDLLAPFFGFAQVLSRAIEDALGADGSFVAMNNKVSQSVPHLHVHVVPRNRKDGLRGFFWPRTTYDDDEEMADYADRLRRAMA